MIQNSANMVLHIYWFMNVKCPCILEVNLTWIWQIMLLLWYWVKLSFCCEICGCNFQGSWPGMPWFSPGFGIRVPLVPKDDFAHALSSWIIYRGGVWKELTLIILMFNWLLMVTIYLMQKVLQFSNFILFLFSSSFVRFLPSFHCLCEVMAFCSVTLWFLSLSLFGYLLWAFFFVVTVRVS